MTRIPGKRLVRPEEEPTATFDWGQIKFLSEPQLTHAKQMTVVQVRLASGQGHLRHNHPGAEEILYFLSGEGQQMVETDLEENGGVPEFYPVRAGDLVQIPASVFHQTINTGSETLDILAIYSPCGPEEVLRSLPDYQLLPAGPWPTS